MNFLFIFLLLFITPVTEEIVDEQITFTYNGDQIKLINKEHYFSPLFNNLFLKHQKIDSVIKKLETQLYEKPVNALMDETGQIISGKLGETVDRAQLKELIIQAMYSKHNNEIEVPMRPVYPKVTSEIIANISTNKISEFNTYYKETNTERSHNIKLATNAINNYVVFPGEQFSFNKVVGKRTKKRGYKKAPVIVRGELAEDIGGGICQVSSTLYNAVILKGIQIVERYSHSREVPYVPPGRDATVSWWGPDFVFKNNYHEPIFIRASAKEGNMYIRIYSSEHLIE